MEVVRASRELEGAEVHVEVIALDGQLLAWAGGADARFGVLHAAAAPRADAGAGAGPPPATALLGGGGSGDHPGAALAQRTSMRLGMPVMLSWNLPDGIAGAEAFVFSVLKDAIARRAGAVDSAGKAAAAALAEPQGKGAGEGDDGT